MVSLRYLLSFGWRVGWGVRHAAKIYLLSGVVLSKSTAPRECQPCTACCDGWLQIRVNGVPVHPGRPCPHSTGSGCSDYENRPVDPCVHFICGWRMDGSPLPDWMKPNNAKVIVLFDQRTWRGGRWTSPFRWAGASRRARSSGSSSSPRRTTACCSTRSRSSRTASTPTSRRFRVRPARVPAGDGTARREGRNDCGGASPFVVRGGARRRRGLAADGQRGRVSDAEVRHAAREERGWETTCAASAKHRPPVLLVDLAQGRESRPGAHGAADGMLEEIDTARGRRKRHRFVRPPDTGDAVCTRRYDPAGKARPSQVEIWTRSSSASGSSRGNRAACARCR